MMRTQRYYPTIPSDSGHVLFVYPDGLAAPEIPIRLIGRERCCKMSIFTSDINPHPNKGKSNLIHIFLTPLYVTAILKSNMATLKIPK